MDGWEGDARVGRERCGKVRGVGKGERERGEREGPEERSGK